MTPEERDRLTRIETQYDAIQTSVAELHADVRAMRETLAAARGGWRVGMAMAGIAGAVGGVSVKALNALASIVP